MRPLPFRWLVVLVACGFSFVMGAPTSLAAEKGEKVENLFLPLEGKVAYAPPADEPGVPERFRLAEGAFSYSIRPLPEVSSNIAIADVSFPSPVVTPSEANNTVHCELYLPRKEGKAPGVIVLHILGGDFALARVFANSLAQRGVAALFLKMPYYGPRRDPKNDRRMISSDPQETVEGMTQAVLDIRRATCFLASRKEIDPDRLGVFGISLGGITASLAASNEPRLQNVCLVLAGGDIGQVAWESKELAKVREGWLRRGGTREAFVEKLREVDPVVYAANARGRRILMLNAKEDDVIPRACTESLWKKLGEPEIVWYEGGHYSGYNLFNAMHRTTRFFEASPAAKSQQE